MASLEGMSTYQGVQGTGTDQTEEEDRQEVLRIVYAAPASEDPKVLASVHQELQHSSSALPSACRSAPFLSVPGSPSHVSLFQDVPVPI